MAAMSVETENKPAPKPIKKVPAKNNITDKIGEAKITHVKATKPTNTQNSSNYSDLYPYLISVQRYQIRKERPLPKQQ